jgi:hypothetical protein
LRSNSRNLGRVVLEFKVSGCFLRLVILVLLLPMYTDLAEEFWAEMKNKGYF